MIGLTISIAVGVFLGNWLITPLVVKDRTFKDGFYIGLIAACLTVVFMMILSPLL